MKRFSLIYMLSFSPYFALALCNSCNTIIAETQHTILPYGIPVFLPLSALALVYQLIYIIILGRKDCVPLGKRIGRFFLYLLLAESLCILAGYALMYFWGYSDRGFSFGDSPITVYYGFQAWDKYSNSWWFPKQFLGLSALYTVLYVIVSVIGRKRKEFYEKMGGENIKETRNITFLTVLPLIIMISIIVISVLSRK